MLPTRLGPYRIIRKVGRGGMGTVYMGIDDSSGQTAAVKLLAADMAQQSDFRDRFRAEIETLRKLNHPNIVQIFGFGEEEGQIYYAMEFVAGSSLEEQIGHGRVFQWREVTQFGIAVARALRHAHDRGVIHRDIKPGNLLLTEEGVLKLSDFGIARLFGSGRMTGVGSVLGTAEFMAPEQADGRPVDPRSDLYSLGGVLYVLLARRPLYDARSFVEMLDKQRLENPAPLRQFAADIPAELEQIVHRLLEKDPDRRFATATVLERRLETLLKSFEAPPAQAAAPVTVDPPPGPGAGVERIPVDPFAPTVISTQAVENPAPPVVPPARKGEVPAGSIGMGGNGPAAESAGAAAESPPTRGTEYPAGRFVPVRPGEFDAASPGMPGGTRIPPQTWAWAIGLVVVCLAVWYLWQPPSADVLYTRIQRQTEGQSTESRLQAEDDIRRFLARFPGDRRSTQLREYAERIEESHLERRLELQAKGINLQTSLSPVERSYLDALNTTRVDPEAGRAKFEAMIDLFESPKDESERNRRCILLAKRRLSEFRQQDEVQRQEQLAFLRERLRAADELRKTAPERAAKIYHALVVLYQNKAWAKDVVEKAGARLEKGK